MVNGAYSSSGEYWTGELPADGAWGADSYTRPLGVGILELDGETVAKVAGIIGAVANVNWNSDDTTEAVAAIEGDPLLAIHELMAPTPEQKRALHQSIGAAEREAATFYLGDPSMQQQVRTYANNLRWLYMGEPGQVPPDGYVLRKYHSNLGVRAVLDTHISRMAVRAIDSRLEQAAVTDFNDALIEKLPMIRTALRQHIMASPGYAFLQGFAQQAPEAVDRPLTSTEYNWRVGQIGEEVCRRYGINASQLKDQMYIAARKEYARAVQRLDDETVRDVQHMDKDDMVLPRLRSFFMAKIADAYKAAYGRDITEAEGDVAAFGDNLYKGLVQLGPELAAIAEEINGSQDIIANYYLSLRISRLFNSAISANQWLRDEELARVSDELADSMAHATSWGGIVAPSCFATVRQSPLPEPVDEFSSPSSYGLPDTLPSYKDQKTVERLANTVVAEVMVDKRTERDFESGVDRLILAAPREHDLPERPPRGGVMTLRFNGQHYRALFGDGVPHIPGFVTAAKRMVGQDYEFDFDRDPAGDPYRNVDAVLPEDRIPRIIKYCQQRGFMAIADALSQRQTLMNGELAAIVRQGSDYYIPASPAEVSPYMDVLVKNGRPQVQCEHAAELCRTLLQIAYGMHSARLIGGELVLGSGKKIAAYGHAQTMLAHNGMVRIYDATPADEGLPFQDPADRAADSLGSKESEGSVADTDTSIRTDEQIAETDEQTAERDMREAVLRRHNAALHGLASSRRTFTLMMRARLGLSEASDQQVWDKIAATHAREGDVIGEVARHIVLAAPSAGSSFTEPHALESAVLQKRVVAIQKTLHYIQKVGEATDQERKQLGLAGYDSLVVQPFHHTLQSLVGRYRQLMVARQQLAEIQATID